MCGSFRKLGVPYFGVLIIFGNSHAVIELERDYKEIWFLFLSGLSGLARRVPKLH